MESPIGGGEDANATAAPASGAGTAAVAAPPVAEPGSRIPISDITIGGRVFKVSIVRMGVLRTIPAAVKIISAMASNNIRPELGEMVSAEQYDAMVQFVHAGIHAADPTYTLPEFVDFCDNNVGLLTGVKELADALAIVAVGSGLQKKAGEPGEAPGPGATSSSDGSTAS